MQDRAAKVNKELDWLYGQSTAFQRAYSLGRFAAVSGGRCDPGGYGTALKAAYLQGFDSVSLRHAS